MIDRLLDDEARTTFAALAHDAIAPALAGLTLSPQPDDTDLSRQLRGDLIRAMGTIANDHEIQEEAQRTVAERRRDPELVEASIMAAAVDVVASFGDEADLDDFLAAYREAETPQETVRYLHATADFPDAALHERIHTMILDGEVRSQNAPFWIRRAMMNRTVGRQTWAFLASHWSELNEMLPSSSIIRMIEGTTVLDRPEDVAAVTAFFAEHTIPQSEKTLAQHLERQRVAASLREREAGRLGAIIDR